MSTASFVDAPGGELIGFESGVYLEIDSTGARLVERAGDKWAPRDATVLAERGGRAVEVTIPFASLGEMESGDELSFSLFAVAASGVRDTLPASGPGRTNLPDLGGGILVLSVDDPEGDDHGPGSYTYPTDSVFSPGVFDIDSFLVEEEEECLKFTVDLVAPIQNHWGSPINLSLPTIDIYIDTDPGAGTGARRLLEGRNAAMDAGYGWEYAIWVEGWNQKVLVPADPADRESRPVEMSGSPLKVRVDADAGTVVIRLPRSLIGGERAASRFGYTLAVLSQEGYPSAGVRRVRDVERAGGQWILGGAPSDVNHTRIIDLAVPATAPVDQQELLSDYEGEVRGSTDAFAADDFARVWVNEARQGD